MSTFEGKLLEDSLDFIRIDQFEPKNHDGTAFFLSHFHTDHFKGIFSEAFLKVLRENEDKMLYCTGITKNLILRHKWCRIPEDKIYPVSMNEKLVVTRKDRQPVQVTPVPAGHCPGSAMFLLEQDAVRVLYTGDFRINPNELRKLNTLHNSDGSLKAINSLYLDTTFCDPKWISFPSRKQTEEDLIEIARDWLDSHADHRVGILYNSYHGLEYLLKKLAVSLNTQVFVRDTQSYWNYICIPELQPWLRQDEADSKVHLCSVREKERCSLCCSDRSNFRTIKPCAQSFDSEQLEVGRRKEGVNGLVRIAYSMHCSLEELIGAVRYLKPDVVHPCALPNNISEQQVLKNLLLDVGKLKQELKEKKENIESSYSASPPAKKFCFSLISEEEEEEEDEKSEEETTLEREEHTVITSCSCSLISCSDEEENKPLSQHFIDSPPL